MRGAAEVEAAMQRVPSSHLSHRRHYQLWAREAVAPARCAACHP